MTKHKIIVTRGTQIIEVKLMFFTYFTTGELSLKDRWHLMTQKWVDKFSQANKNQKKKTKTIIIKVQGHSITIAIAFNTNKNRKEKIRLGHVLTKATKLFKYIT